MSNTQGDIRIVFDPNVMSFEEFKDTFQSMNSDVLSKTGAGANTKKINALLHSLPVPIMLDLRRRITPITFGTAQYEDLMNQLEASYSTKKNVVSAAVLFLHRRQQVGESIEAFAKCLNDLASQCGYKDCCRDRLIRDSFIAGLKSRSLITKIINACEDKTLNQCVAEVKAIDQVDQDVDNTFARSGLNTFAIQEERQQYRNSASPTKNYHERSRVPEHYVCIRCTARGKHEASKCFALKLKCNKCNKIGHIARACKSKVETITEQPRTNFVNTKPTEESSFMYVKNLRSRKQFPALKKKCAIETYNRFSKLMSSCDNPSNRVECDLPNDWKQTTRQRKDNGGASKETGSSSQHNYNKDNGGMKTKCRYRKSDVGQQNHDSANTRPFCKKMFLKFGK